MNDLQNGEPGFGKAARAEPSYGWRTDRYAWVVAVLLGLAFVLSIVDRTILVLFVEPIKRDLDINDTQFSLLTGAAFAIFYTSCGLPLGWLADRAKRASIIVFSILAWSAATLVSGFAAGSYALLFAARIGVGAGEAGLAPSAASMLGDYFPKEARAAPFAFLSLGSSTGAGLTMIFGGALVVLAARMEASDWPMRGFSGWQIVLILLGLVGLLFSLICFLILREPPRQETGGLPTTTLREVFRFLNSRRTLFICVIGGQVATMIALNAVIAWMPSHLIRTAHWQASQTGYVLGGAFLVGAFAGCFSVGPWLRILRARQVKAEIAVLPALATSIASVPTILVSTVTLPWLAVMLTVVAVYFMILSVAVSTVPLQLIAPNRMRGQVFALQTVANGLFATALGPTVVALLTDYLFQDPTKVGLSIALVTGTSLVLAAFLWRGARTALLRSEETQPLQLAKVSAHV